MKKITLTNAELVHLRNIYIDELEKIQKRAEHITSVLQKIDADYKPSFQDNLPEYKRASTTEAKSSNTKSIAKPVADKGKSVPKVTTKKTAVGKASRTKTKKRKPLVNKGVGTKKVKWNDFVLQEIAAANTPLLSSDISRVAMTRFNAKEEDSPRINRLVSGCLSKLVTVEHKLLTQKVPNSRKKRYGMADWFDAKGNLLPEYQNKIKK